ncbi:hypothetical protein JDV09_11305 [Mycobacterium sp. Y57]|uniref:hypothetical protein n=1 Tax=Mycolicibacterium xanthum TaxID=2796469 RepID=UPI001C863D94|nr:hypothetical protein [Mycolicibacterium xanthum]MBX7432686.1 hypothetical protein [Mycolicibacterium xanthum]
MHDRQRSTGRCRAGTRRMVGSINVDIMGWQYSDRTVSGPSASNRPRNSTTATGLAFQARLVAASELAAVGDSDDVGMPLPGEPMNRTLVRPTDTSAPARNVTTETKVMKGISEVSRSVREQQGLG